MTQKFIVVTLLLSTLSCRSVKEYEIHQAEKLAHAYKVKLNSDKMKPASNRKEVRKVLAAIERRMALGIDSMVISTNGDNVTKIDSFYFNPNKINYIKKHNLTSPHKILIPKDLSTKKG